MMRVRKQFEKQTNKKANAVLMYVNHALFSVRLWLCDDRSSLSQFYTVKCNLNITSFLKSQIFL